MTKIVLYPTPVTLSKSVLWCIKRKRKKKKETKKRKKEASHVIKIHVYSRTKLVKLKVPVNIQDNSSCIGEIV